ncbi:MAG: putative baseplate assembly protein [Solirubrobacteraceae bacterium]
MRLPEIELDDRRFQDLVSEARLKINRACPEWTEHNVSDPGITLIELFAWMTEMTIYRLNRVPDKLHVALLDLLGIQLDGPNAARTAVRFRLAGAPEEPVEIAGGRTEVATPRTPNEESIVFQVDEDFVIPAMRPAAYVVQRTNQIKDVGLAGGEARPQGADQLPFGSPPAVGDALFLGFEEPIGRLLVAVEVDASQARGAGVNPEDPPLRWEVSQGDNGWSEAEVLEDLTGGFNYGSGTVELQLPERSAIQSLGGHRMHWLRCRIDDRTRGGGAATTYSHPPEIYSITAVPIGALLPATHASRVEDELLGLSDGTPGQVFGLRHKPVLKPSVGETLEVQDPESGDWSTWELREDFVGSTEFDRHFVLDPVSGEVEFGPAIRETDGGWTQYGAVAPKGAVLRFARYRHGGGRRGNISAGGLAILRSAIPGVDTIINPLPAIGGVDAEALEHARQRASMEIRTRYRAVTAEDFEFLAGEASPRVARAVCIPPAEGTAVPLHIVPHIFPADRQLPYEELVPDAQLLEEVAGYLDERRLIGTTVQLLPCTFRGLSVIVNLQASPLADTARVEEDVSHALYTYLNPLVGGSVVGPGGGWPFGRALNQGELYGVVHAVDGVEFVKILRIYETNLVTGEQSPKPAGTHIVLEPDELIASGAHIVKATHREA